MIIVCFCSSNFFFCLKENEILKIDYVCIFICDIFVRVEHSFLLSSKNTTQKKHCTKYKKKILCRKSYAKHTRIYVMIRFVCQSFVKFSEHTTMGKRNKIKNKSNKLSSALYEIKKKIEKKLN